MKTILQTRRQTKTELDQEIFQFMFSVILVSAVLIGIWGVACLLGGIIANGIVPMVKGYVTAITGV
jgi:hypothetical protein